MAQNYTLMIKQARKAKGITQKQLADLLRVHKKTYVKAENAGIMKLQLFLRICQALDLEIFVFPKGSYSLLGPDK